MIENTFGLDMEKCRDQSYDRAENIVGKVKDSWVLPKGPK